MSQNGGGSRIFNMVPYCENAHNKEMYIRLNVHLWRIFDEK